MATLKDAKRIVIKVGTSTLTHSTGKTNIRRMKALVAVISDIVNSGIEVALVTSGAIGVGVGKLGLKDRPTDTAGKQAAATVGQCELMFMYDKMFGEFGHATGQFLITKRDVEHEECHNNLINAFEKTFEYGAIPIINENDAVAVEEIVYGDNDSLSAIVAKLVKADALLILTDIDGLYDDNPNENEIIALAEKIGLSSGDLNKYPTELSGGMAKRVAFLRLLLCGCDLALLDEPFVGLDRDLRDILATMLVEKIEQQGMACILVTHDRFEAARLSREIMQLSPKGMDVQNVLTLPTPLSERNSAFEVTVVAREFQGIHYYE